VCCCEKRKSILYGLQMIQIDFNISPMSLILCIGSFLYRPRYDNVTIMRESMFSRMNYLWDELQHYNLEIHS
jgi:hypothetical protein